jgi:c-di-GMP-binding flagellar brake protein YcgR
MVDNRRRYARVPMQTEVTCSVGSNTARGRTWNLSQGGMQVEVGSLRPGDQTRVAFRLPNSSKEIEAMGTIVWASDTRQGIQFSEITEQNHEAIREFISQTEAP